MIVKLGQIGDVIMTIPAARALFEKDYSIDWLCGKAVQSLLECYSWINVIPVDEKAILLGAPKARAIGIFSTWNKLAFRKYDLCATLYYDPRYRLLALPVLATRRVMLSRRSRQTTLLVGRNHANEYTRVLLDLEDSCKDESLLPVRPDHVPSVALRKDPARVRIGIVPGGARHLLQQQRTQSPEQLLRRWPIQNYVELARRALDRGWEVVLLGGPDDAWAKVHFAHLQVNDCIGAFSLPEVVSACDTCDAVVSHDTGPLHLAGLSRTCLLGIFGPTDPSTFLPRRPFVVGIWGGQGFACRPCYDGYRFAPCHFNGCMHQVTVALVLREVDHLLDAHSRGVPSPWRIVTPEPVSPSTEPALIQVKGASV